MQHHTCLPVLLAALSGASCTSPAQIALREKEREWNDVLTGRVKIVVDASDGISDMEAFKIAQDYFLATKVIAHGAVGRPKEDGDVWRVPLLESAIGVNFRDVLVRKTDGSYIIKDVAPTLGP